MVKVNFWFNASIIMSFDTDFWSGKKKAVMLVRAKILEAARNWFKEHGFIEVQGPIIIPALSELSGSIEVKILDMKGYLAQGLQPYAEVLVSKLGKIYTIAPSFRAERSVTNRHLIEYWRIEAEIPNCNLDKLMEAQERLVSYICHSLAKEAKKELEFLNRDIRDLERIEVPFLRLTYDEAIEILQKDGFNIQWGAYFDQEHEKHLSQRFNKPFFISDFPINVENFFFEFNPQKPGYSLTVDLFAPEGFGEISSGGQPTFRAKEILRKMKNEKVDSATQKWYIDLKCLGFMPYAGFSIGIERLTQWICKLNHIKEAIAFPRLSGSIYP